MNTISGISGGIILIIISVCLFILAVLSILMPLYIYQIRNSVKQLKSELQGIRRAISELSQSIGSSEVTTEIQTDQLEATQRTNKLLENFLSRFE